MNLSKKQINKLNKENKEANQRALNAANLERDSIKFEDNLKGCLIFLLYIIIVIIGIIILIKNC